MKRLIIIMLASALLYGCIGNPIKDRKNSSVSFVAAHVDMSAMAVRCNGGVLLNLNKKSEKNLWYMYRANHENQCFIYSDTVEPGRYTLKSIDTFYMYGASGGTVTHFRLPDMGKPYGIHNIKKQGVYYLGSFKAIKDKNGRYSLVKSKTPNEKQVLSEMLNHRLMGDGEWKTLIKERASKL